MLWNNPMLLQGIVNCFQWIWGMPEFYQGKNQRNWCTSYNQLQRVNEYSLLETLVRKKNIDTTQLAIDFNIPMDVVYKSVGKIS